MRGVIFSSEAPGTFNMHRSPILAYFFGLTQMSVQTFALPKPLQVNSVESKSRFSSASSLSVRPPPVCPFAILHFSDCISPHFRFCISRAHFMNCPVLQFEPAEHVFKCDQCKKTFGQAGSLNNHKLTYSGEKAHKCAQCRI